MMLKVVVPPAVEPISLVDAKLQCKVDTTDDDALIASLIAAAREEVERLSWHALMTQTLELLLDAWPSEREIVLPRPPLQSVAWVRYRLADGTEHTLDAASYIVVTDATPGRIVLAPGASWPSGELSPATPIRVRYVAGWSSATQVPKSLCHVMLLLVAHWYQHREAVGSEYVPREVPYGVQALTRSYRARARCK